MWKATAVYDDGSKMKKYFGRACQRSQRELPLQGPAGGGRGHGWVDAEAIASCTARGLAGARASAGLQAQIAEEIPPPDRAAGGWCRRR